MLAGMTKVVTPDASLWHHRSFGRLWIAETVSQTGTMVSQIALPLLAILVVHASTFEVGLLTALQSVAFLVIGLPAGAWVDRMRCRNVLIANDILRAVATGSIPLAAALHALTIEQLYAVAVVVGVVVMRLDFENPARAEPFFITCNQGAAAFFQSLERRLRRA